MEDKEIPVRVALRCRPLIPQEVRDGCQLCVRCVPNEPQIVVGADKAFTFDYVFSPDSSQDVVYSAVIDKLIANLFEGYNVTVLAYGQTGSGKTFTMGTNYSDGQKSISNDTGIIPRAIRDIFAELDNRKNDWEIIMRASFLEILKEDIHDLLACGKGKEIIAIREDTDGEIKVVGLTEIEVKNSDHTLELLIQGSQSRTTAATLMNAGSSRSHAVFTLCLSQRKSDTGDVIQSKFHFVDLAGSERAKKTGAQGERFKEGVNINKGLLALGNVISALCDHNTHIPYRDSKLTRLLQDSLGGNSYTVMIACISPADMNMEETINTLRYADRARKIKNKPIVNHGPLDAEIVKLQELVRDLQRRLFENQKLGSSEHSGDETEKVRLENKELKRELQVAVRRATSLCEKNYQYELSLDKISQKLDQLKQKAQTLENELKDHLTEGEQNSELKRYLETVISLLQCINELEVERMGEVMMEEGSPSPDESKEDGDEDCDQDNEFSLEETLRKAAFVKEWEELERSLALKEELANKMKLSESQLNLVKEQYEKSLKQLGDEVNTLQKEKDELLNTLKTVKTNANATKISEQRRKRLQELEGQLSQVRKKMQEQARMLKLKEEAEKKVKILQEEIRVMKQQRVRLMRQMKSESDRHNKIKLEKEKELATLRQQERKRQFELAKMEKQYKMQKNVLQRKMEEAMACNRRLQAALDMKKSVAERREQEKDNLAQGVGARVQRWLSHELAVAISSKEAKYHLQALLDDRKVLSEELHKLRNGRKGRKRSASGESTGSDISLDSSPEKERVDALERDIRLRSSEIQDLQQRILDVDQDEKTKHRWDFLHSMLEAKCALQWLFDQTTSYQLQAYILESKLKDHDATIKEQGNTIKKLTEDIQAIRRDHKAELVKVARKQEDKILYLLTQMKQANDPLQVASDNTENAPLLERLKFQDEFITCVKTVYEDLEKKTEECEALRKELALTKCKGRKVSLLPQLPGYIKAEERIECEQIPEVSESDSDEDYSKDPDWEKTPVAKKTKTVQKKSSLTAGCKCQGNCSKRVCGCRRNERDCTEDCKCHREKCRNWNLGNDKENSTGSLNTTYSKSESDLSNEGLDRTVSTTETPNVKGHSSEDDFLAPLPNKKARNDITSNKQHNPKSKNLLKKFYQHNTSFFTSPLDG